MSAATSSVPSPYASVLASEQAPSEREVLALGFVSWLIFLAVIEWFGGYAASVDRFGDSSAYINAADAIRHWHFAGLVVKQFWGLPYLMAALSGITGMSSRTGLLVISLVCFFTSLVLCQRLWGGWIAAFFALLNFDWLQRAFLGGSEPLFVALLLGSFLAMKKQRLLLGVLLAAVATTVRPLGFIALLAIGGAILWERRYRQFAAAVAIALAVALAYALPIFYAVGDPLATVHSYTHTETGPPLFGFPLYAIVTGTMTRSAPWTNLLLSVSWIVFTVAGIGLLLGVRRFRSDSSYSSVELFFAAGYLLTICSYNLPSFARGSFARFAIPVIPFAIAGWMPCIPRSRVLIWTLAIVSPVLAACSSLGIVNVIHRLTSG